MMQNAKRHTSDGEMRASCGHGGEEDWFGSLGESWSSLPMLALLPEVQVEVVSSHWFSPCGGEKKKEDTKQLLLNSRNCVFFPNGQ